MQAQTVWSGTRPWKVLVVCAATDFKMGRVPPGDIRAKRACSMGLVKLKASG